MKESKKPSPSTLIPGKNSAKTYDTKSVEEIAYLRFRGFQLVGEPYGQGRFKWARFVDSKELREVAQAFWNGCQEKRLFDELRNAKQFLMD